MADFCIQMVLEIIFVDLKFLSEIKTQRFPTVHARPGVGYVLPTSQLQNR